MIVLIIAITVIVLFPAMAASMQDIKVSGLIPYFGLIHQFFLMIILLHLASMNKKERKSSWTVMFITMLGFLFFLNIIDFFVLQHNVKKYVDENQDKYRK